MGQSDLSRHFGSEAELVEFAGDFARRLEPVRPLVVGLRGGLGSGKTTFVRAMLRGLGYAGRVPSPTYTLLEHYSFPSLSIVHLDLYRLGGDDELENLGLRDWLSDPACWIVLEWPEKAPTLLGRCDVVLDFAETGPAGRTVAISATGGAGIAALKAFRQAGSSNAA